MKLNYEQWGTVISRFKSSIRRLEKSGDYPEEKEDQVILAELIGLQYDSMKGATYGRSRNKAKPQT